MIPADEQAESEATPDDTASEEVAPEANAPKIVHFDFYSPDQVPGIQEDMGKAGIKPNIITYSAMIKGYCRMGDIQTAFDILRRMKSEGNARPDEIMYNSLLDGCVRGNLVDEALKLVEEMQQEGVRPSNYTLSILVKLMNRSRNLDGEIGRASCRERV